MRLRFTRRALRHLDDVRAYIADRSPGAANQVVVRIGSAIDGLLVHPERGRPGRVQGTRELIVPGMPYIVAYRLTGDTVDILAILHGAREWPRFEA